MRIRSLDTHSIGRLFSDGSADDPELRMKLGSFAFIYSWLGARSVSFVGNLRRLYQGDLRIFPFRPLRANGHMTDYYHSCLWNDASVLPFRRIYLRPEALDWSHGIWRQHSVEGKPVLVVAPGSGGREKCWSPSFFGAVIRWWEGRTGGRAFVVLGPAEEERMVAESFQGCTLLRGLSLMKLAALLSRCDLYLGNDSGVTHLAAAVGTETVAVFGPTDPVQWKPLGPRVTVLRGAGECAACTGAEMKSCFQCPCLSAVSPRDITSVLERAPRGSVLDKGRVQI